MIQDMQKPSALSPILWLALPAIAFISLVFFETFASNHLYQQTVSENGFIEILQFAVLCLAFLLCLKSLVMNDFQGDRFLMLWTVIMAAGCFYILGEEISWGQHFFGWGTPENWSTINDQEETNLHNVSSWLDQKPRLILELGIYIGGLILPALLSFTSVKMPGWIIKVTPATPLWLTAFILLLFKIIDKGGEAAGIVPFKRVSEFSELYIYYFLMLYIICLAKASCRRSP